MDGSRTVSTDGVLPFSGTGKESRLTIYSTDHGLKEATSFEFMGGDFTNGGCGPRTASRLVIVCGRGEFHAGGGRRGM